MKFELEIGNNYDLISRMMIKPKIAKLKMGREKTYIRIFSDMNLWRFIRARNKTRKYES